jgi:Polyketide cyclase / dehydrase and lipid transport
MQIEHTVFTAASPAAIFRIYEDVANWHTWDPDTKKATLDGPLRVGAKGKLTPTKGNTVPMLVTEVVHNRSFTVVSKIPLFRMIFEHELKPTQEGTEVIHRVTLSGLLSVLLGSMLTKQLNSGLPVTLSNLKALAESHNIEDSRQI